MQINFDEVRMFNHSRLLENITNNQTKKETMDPPGIGPYRLFAYISTKFNNEIIIDLGTRHGGSANAFSFNPTNKVITYDILSQRIDIKEVPNIEFRIENVINNLGQLLSARLIYIDIDPHDGIQEKIIYDYLLNNNYRGTIIFDDICNSWPGMKRFWDSIKEPKIDLSDIGSGATGMVDFS